MSTGIYRKVTDAAGHVSFVEVGQSAAPAEMPGAMEAIDAAGAWVAARAGETSTQIGAIGGAIAAPAIADNAAKALVAGLAGDYVSTALYGVPALLGLFGSLAAMITPEKQAMGPTDEQIKNAVAALGRDQLISLLQQSGSAAGPVPTAAKPL